MSEYAQDKFGYYNGKNSNKDLHFVALYDYELSSVSSRVYSFEHAVTNTLKSIKRLSGAETVFVYEPNTHRDSLITSIGIRIKEIKTYDSGKPVQVRDFVYEKSGVTIDMSKIDYSSYLDRRMYHHHKTGEVTQHLYFYPFTILPGVAMEEANIYYGKVSEIVSDLTTGVKLKTVYEYDTSDWQYEYVDKVYKAPVKTMGEKWKYISSIPDSVNFYTEQLREWYKYIGEIKGYFKYKPIPFGNVSSITTYETINNGAFKICEKQEFKYVKYNKKSLLVENYVKCMATTIYKRTPYKCIKSTKPKDLYYTIINFDQKLPANCNKPDYSIDKPRLYWLYKPKRTYFDEDAKKVKLENSWIYENFMQSVPEDCHRFDIYEDVFIYKLIETKNYQYHGADFIERKTGYTYVVGGVLSGAGYYPQSITTTDDCGVSTTSYSYNDKFPGLCSIKTLKKGDGESIKTQVIYSNFRPQKIIKTVTSGGKTKTIYELRGECLDKFGNYSYFQETGKPDKVIIWGYKGMYPVAEIVNADHAKVLECITQSQIDSIGDATSMDDYIDLLNSLRQKLSEALVTTYTYIPLVGVSSITDPAGRVQLYRYDGAGRLAAVCDEDGNLLETNEYASKTM